MPWRSGPALLRTFWCRGGQVVTSQRSDPESQSPIQSGKYDFQSSSWHCRDGGVNGLLGILGNEVNFGGEGGVWGSEAPQVAQGRRTRNALLMSHRVRQTHNVCTWSLCKNVSLHVSFSRVRPIWIFLDNFCICSLCWNDLNFQYSCSCCSVKTHRDRERCGTLPLSIGTPAYRSDPRPPLMPEVQFLFLSNHNHRGFCIAATTNTSMFSLHLQ